MSVCLATYLLMATAVFKTDKVALVYDLNRSQVANVASDLETQLRGTSEKLKLFAQLPRDLQESMAEDLFSDDSEIVKVAIYKNQNTEPINSYLREKFIETYGIDKDQFEAGLSQAPVPHEEILKTGMKIWNASFEGGPPLIGCGRLVMAYDQHGRPFDQWAVVAYMKLDRILKAVSVVSLSETIVANAQGDVLAQKDAKALVRKPKISDHPLFQKAYGSGARLSVTSAEFDRKKWLAAYARTFNDQIVVMSMAPENEIFRVVKDLMVQTLLFGSIVLTLVIIAAFLLSGSLTGNIAILTERMMAVSEGDLSTVIKLKGRDETVQLAKTFNQMILDLKTSRDELEHMNRELDNKVKERTRQLEEQNQKVKEAQEALLRTTRMASVGEIAGRTAHEVLNPLTSLLTRTGLMQKRVDQESQNRLEILREIREAWEKDFAEGGFEKLLDSWKAPSQLMPGKTLFEEDLQNLQIIAKELADQNVNVLQDMKFIREEGNRVSKIIDNMRRLGHSQSEAKLQSLNAIVKDCCNIMADLFDQQGFKIVTRLDAEPDAIKVDRDEAIQALTNLMRNSLQAIAQGNPQNGEMNIATFFKDGCVFVDIVDNGEGISPENQTRLFETSFTTKSADEGTGLGLGISRRFVRTYDGDIEFISSTPKVKTHFRVNFPLASRQSKGAAA